MNKPRRKKRILVVTPTFTGGSWVVVEDMLNHLKDEYQITCVGLGVHRSIKDVAIVSLPYFRLDALPNKWGSNLIFNVIFQFPVELLAVLYYFILMPDLVLSNGFTSPLGIFLPAQIFKTRIIIYFNSYLERAAKSRVYLPIIKWLGKFADAVFVNSEGSFIDLSRFVERRKIFVINHWTDLRPMPNSLREKMRRDQGYRNKFVISYIGKTSLEKGFDIFIKVMALLLKSKRYALIIAGPDGGYGPDIKKLSADNPSIRDLGFVESRESLRKVITVSDLVWSFGDETYLARPAIEALACGTPIMVPDRPAIPEKFGKATIPHGLIPESVGWIINTDNLEMVAHAINRIRLTHKARDMRKSCSSYAARHYSFKNVLNGIGVIREQLKD